MIRSTVRKHRFGAAALAVLGSVGFVILACETPTPPTIQEEVDVALNVEPAAAELAVADDGYFLVRKIGETVDYVGPVADDKLEVIQEGAEDMSFGILIKKADEIGEAVPLRDALPRKLIRASEMESAATIKLRPTDGFDGPQPLIVIDGIISTDPDILEELDPEDIESIEVIKGAGAKALFGDRAAGGVIQVTTKG